MVMSHRACLSGFFLAPLLNCVCLLGVKEQDFRLNIFFMVSCYTEGLGTIKMIAIFRSSG